MTQLKLKYACYYFSAVYLPNYLLYNSYCVHNAPGVNGTFLSIHMYELSFNYASSEGNGVLSRGMGRYNKDIQRYCSNDGKASATNYDDVVNKLIEANVTQQVIPIAEFMKIWLFVFAS